MPPSSFDGGMVILLVSDRAAGGMAVKRSLALAAVLVVLAGATGLGMALVNSARARSSTMCEGPPGAINICVNGRRLTFAAGQQPYRSGTGAIFAPADVLARQLRLDIRTLVSADGHSAMVTVNRRPFNPAMAMGAKGVEVREGVVYLPLRELALAAGLRLDMDADSGTAGFATK